MKRFTLFLAFIVLPFISVFSQGINFEHLSFDQLLSKAKKENKIVFIDCYATWCGPCKMMARDVFTQAEVGKFFNDNFISAKIDMEKGEGPSLARRFQIRAYPTLIFLSPKGKRIHTIVGARDKDGLLMEAKKLIDPTKQLSYLEKQYKKGNRDIQLISDYLQALQNIEQNDRMVEVGREYLKSTTIEKLYNKAGFNIILLGGLVLDTELYNDFMSNQDKFLALEGVDERQMNSVKLSAKINYIEEFGKKSNFKQYNEEMEKILESEDPRYFDYMKPILIDNFFISKQQFIEWFEYKMNEYESLKKTDIEKSMFVLISTAYRIGLDTKFVKSNLFKPALEKLKLNISKTKDYPAIDFCIALLYKHLGEKDKAMQSVNKFIESDKTQGLAKDSRVLSLIEEIKAMK